MKITIILEIGMLYLQQKGEYIEKIRNFIPNFAVQRSGFIGRRKDSGLFWFFDAGNWEMLVKVLDGCAFNNHFWVFSAATTNVGYTLRVIDTETGAVAEYSNPLGTSAAALTDTNAFASCQE